MSHRIKRAIRRLPVPFEWSETHHGLRTHSHAWGHGFRRVSRTKGYCQCGAKWPPGSGSDNLTYQDVLDYWKDHVEAHYYAEHDQKRYIERHGHGPEVVIGPESEGA